MIELSLRVWKIQCIISSHVPLPRLLHVSADAALRSANSLSLSQRILSKLRESHHIARLQLQLRLQVGLVYIQGLVLPRSLSFDTALAGGHGMFNINERIVHDTACQIRAAT
jgi:hypothetical protein